MTSVRAVLLSTALLIGLAACGSDDDAADAPNDESTQTDEGSGAADDSGPDSGEASGDGSASGTVTMSDGTTYELDVSSCETSATDPGGFPFPGSFDLQGTSDDGFEFYIARAGLSEEGDVQTGHLSGDFDENGQNAGITYSAAASTLEFTDDGADVSGSVMMRRLGDIGPHGAETEATFDFSC